jgi:hypothetical protein
MNKRDMISKLHNDDLFGHALQMAKDDLERQKLTTFVEGFVSAFVDVLAPIVDKLKNNEEIVGVDGDVSGSTGVVNS